MMLEGKQLLEQFIAVGPYLKEVFGRDAMVCVTDREKFLAYYPGEKIDVGVKIGQKVPKEDPIIKAMEIKENIITTVPKEVYGIPFRAFTTPILENGNVIGCIGVAVNMEQEVKVSEVAETLKQSLEQVAGAIQQIAASAGEINTSQQTLFNDIELIAQAAGEIRKILDFIKKIADQTNILGLNAAIEAARAGEHGRGFGVVAEEIRKLSDESIRTSNEIRMLTERIHQTLDTAKLRAEKTLNSSQEQAAATEEITASMEELAGISQELEVFARGL